MKTKTCEIAAPSFIQFKLILHRKDDKNPSNRKFIRNLSLSSGKVCY